MWLSEVQSASMDTHTHTHMFKQYKLYVDVNLIEKFGAGNFLHQIFLPNFKCKVWQTWHIIVPCFAILKQSITSYKFGWCIHSPNAVNLPNFLPTKVFCNNIYGIQLARSIICYTQPKLLNAVLTVNVFNIWDHSQLYGA